MQRTKIKQHGHNTIQFATSIYLSFNIWDYQRLQTLISSSLFVKSPSQLDSGVYGGDERDELFLK